MTPTFSLSIELGNDTMKHPMDVACALEQVAHRLDCGVYDGRIYDEDGYAVGDWWGGFEQ